MDETPAVSEERGRAARRRTAAAAAIFAGTLLASLLANGTSPIVWSDLLHDRTSVRQCVADGMCTQTGTGTSVPGFRHAVSWFELCSLLGRLGLGMDGTHVVMQVLNALAAALVFAVAARLGGMAAGVIAAWLFVSGYAATDIVQTALYNSSILPFLGAVFVLACMAVTARPGLLAVAVAAGVAAILSNVHLACVLSGLSVVCAALFAPRHRLALATAGGLVFALATFAIAPPLWLHNLDVLLHRPEPVGNALFAPRLEGGRIITWSLFAVAAWVASLRSPSAAWARCRRQLRGPLAVILPFLLAFLVARLVGLDATAKYLAHTLAAVALAAALPLALLLRRGIGPRLARADAVWRTRAARALRVAPFALALLLPLGSLAARERPPTIAQMRVVDRVLRDRYGFTDQQIIANVKSSDGIVPLMTLRELAIADPSAPAPGTDPRTAAMLLRLPGDDLPHPLPAGWTRIDAGDATPLLLIVTRSRLDWRRFEVCLRLADAPAASCGPSGLRFDREAAALEAAHFPWGGPVWRGTLTLRVPLLPAGDLHEALFMPRLPQGCGGRIVAADGVHVAPDGRFAELPPGGGATAVTLEWDLGSADCDTPFAYDAWPPFIVAGERQTVEEIAQRLRAAERIDGH